MASHCPFVVIPAGADVDHLRQDKPFLLDAILMVASYPDSPGQMARGAQLVKHISRCVFNYGQKSLDLLQGLLVFLNWFGNPP
jgi:hypothetical protein